MSIWSLTYQQSVFKRMPVTNIYQSFTYKMAAKINWHRYGTKVRHCHCHPMYCCCCCRRHRVAYVLPLWSTCWSSLNIKSTFIVDQQLRVWTEKVLQWYRKFTIVPVECQAVEPVFQRLWCLATSWAVGVNCVVHQMFVCLKTDTVTRSQLS